ncbi:MAG: Gfo/Idh/MocA family oxidoreductase [Gemmatimonadaceae bacterium]|nr:Gfo/Idh/MocA family oxidoreductase [Gemmatimonadaceae bacterium]NUO94968.1 Gfo/Idh/MocA family oxidoreductase [Gemmatimonadaceae bacterium]NUP70190.1 Gfo/Idh/MocA family oxidoreductase [Gemmatimonadaceae bacterium]NUR32480.1 Gfo/Idh/MocA family oxidoreductase [Gemmatimonadaceae bacterium]NUS31607.1 Gfo/Idh/MocA family oxidoreductase [Gemmatimonadaceae bacterium]
MSSLSRRTFLKTSAVAAAGAALPVNAWAKALGANADIRVAVIGLNGRGRNHLGSLAKIAGVRVVALCDADAAVLAKVKPTVNGGSVKTYQDIRALLADKEVDAVTIATPNHWHSLAAIWALQAGKDVYLEKPVSHNVWEGRQLVAAAHKHDRIIQAGTQIRSGEGLREAVEWVRAGNIGKITASRGFCYKRRDSIGKTAGPQPVPASIDYNLWSGPAPLVPPYRNTKNGPVHYDWHWIWLYGNGDVGNQGIHQMDVARWFLGEPGLPQSTLSVGGRLGYVDDGETPNTQVVIHEYATAPLIFEVRGLPTRAGMTGSNADPRANADSAGMDNYRGVNIGNVIDCEGGSLITNNYFTATAVDRTGKTIREFKGTDRHMQNFIDVVRSRKKSELFGPIEEGHVSSALCHLGNISHRLGHASTGEVGEKTRSSAMLAEAYGRMLEHLKANEVDVGRTPLTVGVPLLVDAKRERFSGPHAEQANEMLTREYRAPFVVPSMA